MVTRADRIWFFKDGELSRELGIGIDQAPSPSFAGGKPNQAWRAGWHDADRRMNKFWGESEVPVNKTCKYYYTIGSSDTCKHYDTANGLNICRCVRRQRVEQRFDCEGKEAE